MTRPNIVFDEVNERQGVFHRRAFLLGGGTGLGLLALAGRLAQLQLLQSGRYRLLSEKNEFEFRLTAPPRGLILDRDGVVLASNRPDFRLLASRDEHTDIEDLIARLGDLVPLDDVRKRRLAADLAAAPRRAPVTVTEDMTWEEFARVNVRAPELPGVTADMGELRVYPFGGAFAHVVGYVSKVTAADVTKTGPNSDPILLNPGFRIGKQGIEKSYDLELRGKPGGEKVEVDVKGRVIRNDPAGNLPSTPGETLRLTLDADVQNRALEVFGDDSGAAVMMDCRSGDLLCLFSAPSFDANAFVKGLTGAEYRALAEFQMKPLLNKAITATYPPGSTFKTMVALAALDKGIDPNRTYYCGGVWFWGGRAWHCDKAHGVQNMEQGIANSCDIFFYQTALSVGPDPIAAVAREFGLGKTFDIGIPGQKPGLIPDTAYKRRAFPHDPVWHPGETPSMGIGQGYVNVNALQLCVQVSRLANARVAVRPRLVHSVGDVVQPSGAAAPLLSVNPQHLQFVRAAMASVVTSGTAAQTAQLGLGPVMMAGKTGTAQAHAYKSGHGEHGAVGAWAERDHAWFIAFAPYDDPRYAVSVLVEHGGFGAEAAAPKARELMRVVLLKDPQVRARIVQPMPAAPPPTPALDQPSHPSDAAASEPT
ncbi:MAG TPA: penicillin-binding protein 2 [Caulobacteraceae bacterium]|nr:penicillin-binding protein 2 [Caulobacteraceae bacterium]